MLRIKLKLFVYLIGCTIVTNSRFSLDVSVLDVSVFEINTFISLISLDSADV